MKGLANSGRRVAKHGETPAELAGLLLLLIAMVYGIGSPSLTTIAVNGLIDVVAVVGVYVFVGNSGIVSFGQVGFMAIGAYIAGLLTAPAAFKEATLPHAPGFVDTVHASPLVAILIAGLVCGACAAICGFALMRLSGMAASIATMALLIIVYTVINNWTAVTDGPGTLGGIPTFVGLFSGLVWAVVAVIVAYAYQRSAAGLRLRAAREDVLAAGAAGVNVVRERLVAFALSAFIMGVAGALYGAYLGSLSPSSFYFDTTFLFLVMLVVGGMRSLTGAVFGAIMVVSLNQELLRLESGFNLFGLHVPGRAGAATLVLAVVLLVVLIKRPGGFVGDRELRLSLLPVFIQGLVRPRRDGSGDAGSSEFSDARDGEVGAGVAGVASQPQVAVSEAKSDGT
jgi:branched-chain amino acid transport system permease protein